MSDIEITVQVKYDGKMKALNASFSKLVLTSLQEDHGLDVGQEVTDVIVEAVRIDLPKAIRDIVNDSSKV